MKIHEAKTMFSKLLARVEKGEEFIVCRGDQPLAKLVPLKPEDLTQPTRPKLGTLTSAPVQYDELTFGPLDDDELKGWGL